MKSPASPHPGSSIRGLLLGAVCGAIIGFVGFGPPTYVFFSIHDQFMYPSDFFGYGWTDILPIERARTVALNAAVSISVIGAVVGLIVGERRQYRPISFTDLYLMTAGCAGLGLLGGMTTASRLPENLLEGPILFTLSGTLAGYLGCSVYRLSLNRELAARERLGLDQTRKRISDRLPLILSGLVLTAIVALVVATLPGAPNPADTFTKLGGEVEPNWGGSGRSAKLRECTITDEQLAALDAIPDLSELTLYKVRISDDQLAQVARLPGLTGLDLKSETISDADIQHLAHATRLTDLNLPNPQLTDIGIRHLAGLTSLESLGLQTTQVSDAVLADLKGLVNLRKLWLFETRITDQGLAHLVVFPSLQILSLSETRVTDQGLAHLIALPSLRKVFLGRTAITDEGVEWLSSERPELEVVRD